MEWSRSRSQRATWFNCGWAVIRFFSKGIFKASTCSKLVCLEVKRREKGTRKTHCKQAAVMGKGQSKVLKDVCGATGASVLLLLLHLHLKIWSKSRFFFLHSSRHFLNLTEPPHAITSGLICCEFLNSSSGPLLRLWHFPLWFYFIFSFSLSKINFANKINSMRCMAAIFLSMVL